MYTFLNNWVIYFNLFGTVIYYILMYILLLFLVIVVYLYYTYYYIILFVTGIRGTRRRFSIIVCKM